MDRQQSPKAQLRQEIMLQVNERLYIQGMIPEALYEQARIKIVENG